ncbi:MAG: PIN domain nuclease [Dehalococcoidia bacterium]|nr:PIN domain nuclease [Dehalococcoidia bacterium]
MNIKIFSRVFGGIVFSLAFWLIGGSIAGDGGFHASGSLPLILAIAGFLAGIFLAPVLTYRPLRWISQTSGATVIAIITGVLLSLLAGALLALPLSLLPGVFGKTIPAAVTILLIYMGTAVLLARGKDLFQLLSVNSPVMGSAGTGTVKAGTQKLIVDTSAIIDGRIADISQTGFIHGVFVIPKFVLQELQYIADSSDPMRRKRGRRGLEMLNKLKKEADVPIQVSDIDFDDTEGVDAKLVKLARQEHSPIITNDYNLNRVAELQGVRALNINELAIALRPVVLSGEEMDIRITQEGKEPGQGVGFLDDGTMVVVEGGRRHLNSSVGITITRVLQTAMGRMIFAQVKNGTYHERG